LKFEIEYLLYLGTSFLVAFIIMALSSDPKPCPEHIAWPQLDSVARDFEYLTNTIENSLMEDPEHSSEMWFSWGLLDVHINALSSLITTNSTSGIYDDLQSLLYAIDSDICDLIRAAELCELSKSTNRYIDIMCRQRGRPILQRAFQSAITIKTFDVCRRRRRTCRSIQEPLRRGQRRM
jgi:hypothetical protein